MSTGMVDSWGGTITDIGPLYPFVGAEVLFWIIGMAFWVIWHVWQYRTEKREYEDEVAKYGSVDTLKKVMRGEQVT